MTYIITSRTYIMCRTYVLSRNYVSSRTYIKSRTYVTSRTYFSPGPTLHPGPTSRRHLYFLTTCNTIIWFLFQYAVYERTIEVSFFALSTGTSYKFWTVSSQLLLCFGTFDSFLASRDRNLMYSSHYPAQTAHEPV